MAFVAGAAGGIAIDEGVGHYKSQLAWRRAKRMAKMKHQWETTDLRRAGLNPILSAMKGGGGPGPPAPMAGNAANTIQTALDNERKSLDSGSGRKTARLTRQQLTGQRDLLKSQYDLMVEQAGTERTKQGVNMAQEASIRQQTRRYGPVSDLGGAASKFTRNLPGAADVFSRQLGNTVGGGAGEAWRQQKELNRENLEFIKDKLNELEEQLRQNRKRSVKFREQFKADEKRSR